MQENNYAELEDETASGGERAKQTERPINPQQHLQQPQKPIQSQSSTSMGSSSASNSASKKDKSKKSKDVSLILILKDFMLNFYCSLHHCVKLNYQK